MVEIEALNVRLLGSPPSSNSLACLPPLPSPASLPFPYLPIPSSQVLSTVFAFFALSTVVCALIFFLLGFLNAGSLMQFFPRHVLIGCIGGVGLFLVMTSFEVSTGVDWDSTNTTAGCKLLLLCRFPCPTLMNSLSSLPSCQTTT